ncbi:MAG: L,D-transpeptidase [Planctomycetes bacterium]|nr:L,D-transpeptidase [Planctomycetota bacterium]
MLIYNNIPLKTYKIGIGQNDSTPSTEFVVGTKAAKPVWYSPKNSEYKGEVIPYGDSRNILGTHWIGLNHQKFSGIGIHGTNSPSSIGTKSSRGCIRLENTDVEELYEILPQGTKVVIN